MTPDEQRQGIRDLIAFYEARGWDWLDIVGYRATVFTGRWPLVKIKRNRGGRPRKDKQDDTRRNESRI